MELDIDRLHNVFFGGGRASGRYYRHKGRTTLWASYLVSLSLLPDYEDKTIGIAVMYWRTVVRDYLPAINMVSKAMGVPFEMITDELFTINNTRFVFLQGYENKKSGFDIVQEDDICVSWDEGHDTKHLSPHSA